MLRDVAATSEPHRLCTYLFDTAKAFTDFYENCPVLPAADDVRANRLALCRLAAATLHEGLGPAGDRGAGAHVAGSQLSRDARRGSLADADLCADAASSSSTTRSNSGRGRSSAASAGTAGDASWLVSTR